MTTEVGRLREALDKANARVDGKEMALEVLRVKVEDLEKEIERRIGSGAELLAEIGRLRTALEGSQEKVEELELALEAREKSWRMNEESVLRLLVKTQVSLATANTRLFQVLGGPHAYLGAGLEESIRAHLGGERLDTDEVANLLCNMARMNGLTLVHYKLEVLRPEWRCGSCRDTGLWESGIQCPACGGTPKT
jgi:chromosome segregation ATPase